jgi:hypothetical protein
MINCLDNGVHFTGKGPEIHVFDGATGTVFPPPLRSFLAFNQSFLGGVYVACGDVTGDTIPDLIAAKGGLDKPEVRVFDGVTAAPLPPPLGSFLAFNQSFPGGVRVAACDLNRDDRTDIVAARGPLGQPEVRLFDGATGNVFPPPLGSFLAFNQSFLGGVHVACGDVSGDTIPDLIAAKGGSGQPEVRVFDGVTAAPLPPPLGSFLAFNQGFLGGVRVAACDLNQDGSTDIIAGRGPGAQPEVRTFDGVSGTPFAPPLGSFLAFNANFKGGVYVACPQAIAASCTPGAPGCGWSNGDMIAFDQVDWGGTPGGNNAAAILENNYVSVYAPSGELEVGIGGAAGFSMTFRSATGVLGYLPAFGPAGTLDADLVDPTSSASGAFGGDVVALKLNVDFSAAALIGGTSGLRFGDLTLCGFSSPPGLNGMTVAGFLGIANTVLGGSASPFTVAEVAPIALELNGSFFTGVLSVFAQTHLVNGACP